MQQPVNRQRIWEKMKEVAVPDTRLHLDFSEFIPDFKGSAQATARIIGERSIWHSGLAFVTPDNSTTEFRQCMIEAGIPFVMASYNMRRGFLYLAPGSVPKGAERYASWLDGMEHFAKPITLAELADLGKFDVLVTGASAVSTDGLRFGKGHFFLDLEWAMFTDMGLMQETTPVAAIVHDYQVVEDRLSVGETEFAIDLIATPTRMIRVDRSAKRPRGVRWDRITPREIEEIPSLRELARLRGIA
ncbi:5-formyltetrahydrofolate cyclo-ligase [Martelella endophytica]|uniref:5-formyltetrahydrofolate cyclo-ligase n=1 Tax=Martelella endophytica TaxID=1486262 RepID=A0A0D5LMQ5_MAREN|nr:5-formyltetrahydrofolate cyclo-ligase [Martelella endophytica]AJY45479.1 5-formyltetrahydrofolate cyclo-ligase [Martelella endophytica]